MIFNCQRPDDCNDSKHHCAFHASVSSVHVFPWTQFFKSKSHTIVSRIPEQRTDNHRTCYLLSSRDEAGWRREGRWFREGRVMMGHVEIWKQSQSVYRWSRREQRWVILSEQSSFIARFPCQQGTCEVHDDDLRSNRRTDSTRQVNHVHVKLWMYSRLGLADLSLSLRTQIKSECLMANGCVIIFVGMDLILVVIIKLKVLLFLYEVIIILKHY